MKKLILLAFLYLLLGNAYGQSFLKARNNLFKFGVPSSKYKIGLGIGHERFFLDKPYIKILFGQDIDYKHCFFTYYDGGLGGGDNVSGNINFLSGQLNLKTRIGKNIFFEAGLFSSYALLKKITKGEIVVSRVCLTPTPCPTPPDKSITNESSNFKNLDFGPLLGIGYSFKDLKITIDSQFGLKNIIDLNYSQLTSIQFNLNIIKPLKFNLKDSKTQ